MAGWGEAYRRGPRDHRYAGPSKRNDNARRLAELLRLRDFPLPCTFPEKRDLFFSDDPDEQAAARAVCAVCPMKTTCPVAFCAARPRI